MQNKASTCQCFEKHNVKPIFGFISAVFIPILAVVITVILSLQQESLAKANRDTDLHIAEEQHKQNLELALDEQRNGQLTAYIYRVSDLLLANNFSLNEQILTSIVRPQTLSTLRQLDTTRKGFLLRFLDESRLISILNSPFLNLRNADFSGIQIGLYGDNINMRYSSFFGVSFKNASFTFISFGLSDFSFCDLRGATLRLLSFDYAKFDSAQLQNADFGESDVYKADFTQAKMNNAKISQKQIINDGSVSGAILPDGSQGRNRNLFTDPHCQILTDKNGIERNFSTSELRQWMTKIRRTGKLTYFLSGWFDKLNGLRANFTELNRTGTVVHRYCVGPKDFVAHWTNTQFCYAAEWTFPSNSLSNYSNQYKYATQRIDTKHETHIVNVEIILGQNGTCRDMHFSFET